MEVVSLICVTFLYLNELNHNIIHYKLIVIFSLQGRLDLNIPAPDPDVSS
jgi:hypothetical protein